MKKVGEAPTKECNITNKGLSPLVGKLFNDYTKSINY